MIRGREGNEGGEARLNQSGTRVGPSNAADCVLSPHATNSRRSTSERAVNARIGGWVITRAHFGRSPNYTDAGRYQYNQCVFSHVLIVSLDTACVPAFLIYT